MLKGISGLWVEAGVYILNLEADLGAVADALVLGLRVSLGVDGVPNMFFNFGLDCFPCRLRFLIYRKSLIFAFPTFQNLLFIWTFVLNKIVDIFLFLFQKIMTSQIIKAKVSQAFALIKMLLIHRDFY